MTRAFAAQAVTRAAVHLSTQETPYQQELAARLHLPLALLSDAELRFAAALRLPTFRVGWRGAQRAQAEQLAERVDGR